MMGQVPHWAGIFVHLILQVVAYPFYEFDYARVQTLAVFVDCAGANAKSVILSYVLEQTNNLQS